MIKESDIQIACNVLLNHLSKAYLFRHFHVPKKKKKKISFQVKLKKMGLRAGAPDMIIEYPKGKMLYLEIKNQKGKLSEAQKLWKVQSSIYETPHFIIQGNLSDCLYQVESIIKKYIPLKQMAKINC